jgi:hypothetical protein
MDADSDTDDLPTTIAVTQPEIDLGGLKPLAVVQRKACRTCMFSEMEGKDRVCRLNPPHITWIAVPSMQLVQTPRGPQQVPGMELRSFSGFPIVQHDQFCWQYKRKVPE